MFLGNLPTTADNLTGMIVTLGPSLKRKKGLLVYLFKFWHNLPRWSISTGLIGWYLSVIMKSFYFFFCW